MEVCVCLRDFHTEPSLCLHSMLRVSEGVGHNASLNVLCSPHTERQRKMVMVMARTGDRVAGDVNVGAS